MHLTGSTSAFQQLMSTETPGHHNWPATSPAKPLRLEIYIERYFYFLISRVSSRNFVTRLSHRYPGSAIKDPIHRVINRQSRTVGSNDRNRVAGLLIGTGNHEGPACSGLCSQEVVTRKHKRLQQPTGQDGRFQDGLRACFCCALRKCALAASGRTQHNKYFF
jgi:hypothetical protein